MPVVQPQEADVVAFIIALMGGISGLTGFFSMLAIFFYSALRIERQMKRDGLPRPCAWDMWMYRLIFYGSELIKSHERLLRESKQPRPAYEINLKHLIRYVRPIDRVIARTALASTAIALMLGAVLMLYQQAA
ncbi:MAG: hypothetical protein ACK4KV_20090 [Rhodocyclaceae bacterium]